MLFVVFQSGKFEKRSKIASKLTEFDHKNENRSDRCKETTLAHFRSKKLNNHRICNCGNITASETDMFKNRKL